MKLLHLIIGSALAVTALPAQDPPSRVARLNLIDGTVSFQPASLDTWTQASLNYPLTTGDHLYTDAGSRAEAHIGPNAIRLDSRTIFGFLNLDDDTVQMRFTEGALEIRLRELADNDVYEIDTPDGAISLLRTGDYRVDTDPDRSATMVTVFSGEAEVTANGRSFAVHPRETAYFTESSAPDIRGANPPDDFDRFTAARNYREERLPPPQHVSSTMIGYEDLSAYGSWRQVPEYGWCWAPPVAAEWAPYRDGHWAWVEPWGWTWIDEAPWGFAPFHYGRWALTQSGWVWIPGAATVRQVYAPALVAFIGGPRFNLSIGIGGGIGAVAWFPLGPQEVYRPAYRVSNTYIRNVNVTNVTNINVITNVNVNNVHYVNQNVQNAVTAVPQNAFSGARIVSREAFRLNPQQIGQAQVVGTAPAVAPVRESVAGATRANPNVARPDPAVMSRRVIARATPPPPPVAFEMKQAALAQNQGRPLAPEQMQQLRQQQPAGVVNRAPIRSAALPDRPNQQPDLSRRVPENQPAVNRPLPENRSVFRPDAQPANRMDSRPPNGGIPARAANPPSQVVQQPGFNNPPPENRPVTRPDQPAGRPAGRIPVAEAPPNQPVQQPRFSRPAPQNEPAVNRPVPANTPAARPENQPSPARANAAPVPPPSAPRRNAPGDAPKKEGGKEERGR